MEDASPKVLVVDDDEAILEALCMLLELEGYSVFTAERTTFFDVVKKKRPNVILLDVWLSGFDGSLLCKKLKADKSISDIQVFLMSASKDVKNRAEFCGADGYIEKPFTIEDINKKILSISS